jgi:hypothetical protein
MTPQFIPNSFNSDLDLFSVIIPLFSDCIIFHKLDISNLDIDFIEDRGFLDWFDYVIVDKEKGVVCITSTEKVPEKSLSYKLLLFSDGILPGRIKFVFGNHKGIEALNEAKNILDGWDSSPEYLSMSEEVITFLKDAMQIESLPPRNFNGRMSANDDRFIRLSKNHGAIKILEVELKQKKNDLFKKINIHIQTGAGSGKTIAAKYAYRHFSSMGFKTIFVCYNHLLGNWLRHDLNPKSGYVGTLYHFAYMELQRCIPGYSGDGDHVKILLENIKFKNYVIQDELKFDTLIIDEGQDFDVEWIELLQYFMNPPNTSPSVIWLGDDNQSILWNDSNCGLNPNTMAHLEKIVGSSATLSITDLPNCRTPQRIDRYMKNFFLSYNNFLWDFTFYQNSGPSINKIDGYPVKTIFYDSDRLLHDLENRIDILIEKEGIRKENIVIISCLPSEANESILLNRRLDIITKEYNYQVDRIGKYVLQRETGRYNSDARKIYYHPEDGIRCESIYKYKGLEDAVVLVIDVEEPTNLKFTRFEWSKRLYCAFTRATLKLEIFIDSSGNMKQCFDDVNQAISHAEY